MKKKIILSLSVLLALIGIAVAIRMFFFGETPESKIRQTFTGLAESIRKDGEEGMLVMMERVKSTSRLFTDPCRFRLERVPNGIGLMRRKDIVSNALMLRRYFRSMRIRFYDLEIQVDPKKDEASVIFTVAFEGTSVSGRNIREAMEMEAILTEQDGKWIFRSVSIREIIRK